LLEALWLWGIAALMAVITSWLVKRAIYAKSPADTALVLYLLVTMASMFGGAVIYLLSPSVTSILEAVALNAVLMTGGIIFVLRFWAERYLDESTTPPVSSAGNGTTAAVHSLTLSVESKVATRVAAIFLILLNEFLMGWAFVLASGSSALGNSGLMTFDTVVGSDWFIFTMSLEMILSIYFLRNSLPRNFFIIVLLQSAIMFFAPTAINNPTWVTGSIYAGSVVMIGLLIFFYEYLFNHRSIAAGIRRYLVALISVYALMMAGLYVWLIQGSSLLFVVSILAEMVLYFDVILSGKSVESGDLKSWMVDPRWVFAFLAMTFVAEYFMGGLFDIEYYGTGFVSSISLAPISGSIATQVGAAFYDFISYFGAITGSAWFLIMMGIEMGALVVFKIRITRELETRLRLVLVLVAYFVYSIALPSFILSNPASVPFVGWSMGIGTAGAVAPVFLGAIIGTYVITAVLSFLFGSRQTCSLFCTAALMYQGTFYDSMKDFNRSSKLGRKLLTSRISNLYKTVASIVVISVIAVTIVSYLNAVGIINFTFFGTDVAYFLYIFYFNFLWYIIFISIPFVGTYGCVTTGMCHIGLFNQFVSRFGLFRLKVKNPQTCVTCATKDCAKACPVGLTDLPSKFISTGEFRSHKCIGVGDCISACPYENEYIYDVRGWLREKLGRKPDDARPGRPHLPIIHTPGNSSSHGRLVSSGNKLPTEKSA
jgi:polyferredoxin